MKQPILQVSLYTAAFTITFAITIISQSFRAAIYPVMVQYHKTDQDQLRRVYDFSFYLLGIISLPAVAGILTLSEQIITLIYQAPFWGAIKPLQVLAWVIILYFLNVPNVRMMLVFDKQDVINRYLVFSLLLNATLNIFLDPILGATGAAISRVCAVFILFILAHFYVNRVIYPNQALKYLIKPAIASSIMAVAVELISSFGIWIAIVIGIFSYLVLLYLFGCIKDVKEFVNSQSVALSET